MRIVSCSLSVARAYSLFEVATPEVVDELSNNLYTYKYPSTPTGVILYPNTILQRGIRLLHVNLLNIRHVPNI